MENFYRPDPSGPRTEAVLMYDSSDTSTILPTQPTAPAQTGGIRTPPLQTMIQQPTVLQTAGPVVATTAAGTSQPGATATVTPGAPGTVNTGATTPVKKDYKNYWIAATVFATAVALYMYNRK